MKNNIQTMTLILAILSIAFLFGCVGNAVAPATENIAKPMTVKELVAAVVKEPNAWKDKEVTIRGEIITVNLDRILTMRNIEGDDLQFVSCDIDQTIKSEDFLTKTVELKGKISKVDVRDKRKDVELKPCEIKK